MGESVDSGWRRGAWIFSKILLVHVLVGPPVGALTFFMTIGLLGEGPEGPITNAFWMSLFGLVYGVPFSYFVGALPAALVGCVSSIGRLARGRVSIMLSALAGLIAGLWLAKTGGQSAQDFAATSSIQGILVATCVAPAIICGMLTRRM